MKTHARSRPAPPRRWGAQAALFQVDPGLVVRDPRLKGRLKQEVEELARREKFTALQRTQAVRYAEALLRALRDRRAARNPGRQTQKVLSGEQLKLLDGATLQCVLCFAEELADSLRRLPEDLSWLSDRADAGDDDVGDVLGAISSAWVGDRD